MQRAVFAVALAASLALAAPARADLVLGADLDVAAPVGDAAGELSTGYGVAGRIGAAADIGPVQIAPELGLGYTPFPVDDPRIRRGDSTSITRFFGGARVALLGAISPAAYARVGLGWLGGGATEDRLAPAVGGGVALDLRVIPVVAFGAHVGYNVLLDTDEEDEGGPLPVQWLALGLHGTLEF